MSGFKSIIGQERPLRILAAILKSDRIPHALLFTGIEGIGKLTSARVFAMALNCIARSKNQESTERDTYELETTAEPCLRCRSCKKIKNDNHPDIIYIKPSGTVIKVGQIRELCRVLSLKPYEAKRRVVIISDAHTLNPAAGNALLKVLEEPPDQTTLVLTAINASDLLPTIVSRCQHIRFNPIPHDNLTKLLVEKAEISSDDATILSALAEGSFSKAHALSHENWINRRTWLIYGIKRALDDKTNRKSGNDRFESLPPKSIGFMLAFAEQLSKNKDRLWESLEIMKSWLRDLVVCKYHPDKIINQDFIETIAHTSKNNTTASLLSKMDAIGEAQKDIQANTNVRLTLEVLMLRLTHD